MQSLGQSPLGPQRAEMWRRIPQELRDRAQWALAASGPDKKPLTVDGRGASSTNAATWTDFDTASRVAAERGWHVGYMLSASDAFACIDLDWKDANTHPDEPHVWTTPEDLEAYQRIAAQFDTYAERSRSGMGLHLWVRANIGRGFHRAGIEVYSQERFIICTGDAWINKPVAERQTMLANMVSQMRPAGAPTGSELVEVAPAESDDVILERATSAANGDKFNALWAGQWDGYGSQSEADLALLGILGFYSASNEQVRRLFRQSVLGQREKARKNDRYLNLTLTKIRDRQWAEQQATNAVVVDLAGLKDTPSAGATAVRELPGRKLVGRSLGGVQARSIDWLWTGWIPKGYITIFAGETGAGKSTILADIAARITTGAPWPGEYIGCRREPARVLWLGSEDSIEEMTIPRLMACGANLHNVIEIEGVTQNGKRNTFSMQDDLEAVCEWLASARDEGLPFAMLVIDPVTSYLPGQKLRKVDLNDAGQLRTILEPWLKLAQEHKIAIVCVTHFAKDQSRAMLHRVLGSAAFAQTCRSFCAVIEPPATEDYEPGPHEKALLQVKVNLPEHPGGAWKFSTERVEVGSDPDNGKPIYATKPDWEQLDSALTPKTAVGRARGPVSKYEMPFALWLQAYFASRGVDEWLRTDMVKAGALAERVVSENWWNKHSGDYLEKKNDHGFWFCKPKAASSS